MKKVKYGRRTMIVSYWGKLYRIAPAAYHAYIKAMAEADQYDRESWPSPTQFDVKLIGGYNGCLTSMSPEEARRDLKDHFEVVLGD